jgi:molybdopterin/thiamine biosynthesis adenylyltransferase
LAVVDESPLLQSIIQRSQNSFLSLADAQLIALQFGCSLGDIEAIALDYSRKPARFKRNSLSCPEQLRLLQSRVAIIGCGGLGGRTAELLARIGIGHLILTDPDSFSESNLNRQIFCTSETLGLNKVEVLARELEKINPALTSTLHINFFNDDSIAGADIVIDGLDSVEARLKLSKLCRKQNIPLVHGAVKEWYGQAGIDQKSNELINTLYSKATEPSLPPKVSAMNVAHISSIQAAETIKLLLHHNSPLQSSWLQTDLLHCEYDTIKTS